MVKFGFSLNKSVTSTEKDAKETAEDDTVEFSLDPYVAKRLEEMKKSHDDRNIYEEEKLYKMQTDKDCAKIIAKTGGFKKRNQEYLELRGKDVNFRNINRVRPLGRLANFNEVTDVTMDASWRATTRPYGVIAHKRYLEWLRNLPPGPSEQELQCYEQVKTDKKLWDNIRFGYLEKTKKELRDEYCAERELEKQMDAKIGDLVVKSELEVVNETKFNKDSGHFELNRAKPTERQFHASMRDWSRGIYYPYDFSQGFPYYEQDVAGLTAAALVTKITKNGESFEEEQTYKCDQFNKEKQMEHLYLNYMVRINCDRAREHLKQLVRARKALEKKLAADKRKEEKQMLKMQEQRLTMQLQQAQEQQQGNATATATATRHTQLEGVPGLHLDQIDADAGDGVHLTMIGECLEEGQDQANDDDDEEEQRDDLDNHGASPGAGAGPATARGLQLLLDTTQSQPIQVESEHVDNSNAVEFLPGHMDLWHGLSDVRTSTSRVLQQISAQFARFRASAVHPLTTDRKKSKKRKPKDNDNIEMNGIDQVMDDEGQEAGEEDDDGEEEEDANDCDHDDEGASRSVKEFASALWTSPRETINSVSSHYLGCNLIKVKKVLTIAEIEAANKAAALKMKLRDEANEEAIYQLFQNREKQLQREQRFRLFLDRLQDIDRAQDTTYDVDDLIMASKSGNYNRVMDILDHEGTTVSPNDVNDEGITATYATLMLLLSNETIQAQDVSFMDNDMTLWERFILFLNTKKQKNNLDLVIQILLFRKGNIRFCKQEKGVDGYAIVHQAVKLGAMELVAWLLRKGESAIAPTSLHKQTPLMVAAEFDQLNIVLYLLEFGAMLTVNGQDELGNTALHYVAMGGSTEIAQVLMICGARTNIRNKDGRLPQEEAQRKGRLMMMDVLKTFRDPVAEHTKRIKFLTVLAKERKEQLES